MVVQKKMNHNIEKWLYNKKMVLQKYPSMTLTYPSMALTTTTLLTYIMQALSWRQVQDNASLQAT